MLNLRSSAALVLVGWYLMVPPWPAKTSTPLSQWIIVKSFDTAANCESGLHQQQVSARALAKHVEQGTSPLPKELPEFEAHWFWATCIATDDPRLKDN
jgi:hypothetical protein